MKRLMTSLRLLTSTFAMSLAMVPAWAQSAPAPAPASVLSFELNAARVVDRLTVLDFKDLPAGKTKVTRFDLAGADCGKLSRVLINSATECAGSGVDPAACMRALKTSTRTAIAFGV
ncbi:MAG: hypothetical protein E5V81_13815 [Mesorhizobium sp.]|nr:MAG: hypothetical protein E5V81_13815 [Mesorhizobium sp.]